MGCKMQKLFSRRNFLFSIALAGLIAFTFCSDGFAQLQGLQKAAAAKTKAKANLFQIDGVAAAGISADQNNNAIIKVYTDKRGVAGVPANLDGVPVTVEFVGKIFAWDRGGKKGGGGGGSLPTDRYERPVPIGVSAGTTTLSYCFAGTLGCRLKEVDVSNGNVVGRYMLSNNHVFAEENSGLPGIDQIIQPGTLDNGCVLDSNDVVGTLFDFVRINFIGQSNLVDAAIATTTTAECGTATPSTGWGNPTSTSVAASIGQVVQKYGRTTGLTEGTVDSINVSVNVGYDAGTAAFDDQIVIRGRVRRGNGYRASSFSDSGDSGSLIVDQSNNPVGLLFAGNSTVTIANPIDTVLDQFSNAQDGTMMFVDDGN